MAHRCISCLLITPVPFLMCFAEHQARQMDTWYSKGGICNPVRLAPFSQPTFPIAFLDSSHKKLLLFQELWSLLDLGAIEEVPYQHRRKGFYYRYFLVPKKSGGFCPILDVRKLNKFIKKIKFKSLPHGNTSFPQEVPSLCGRHQPLPVHSASFRLVLSPKSFHQVHDSSFLGFKYMWTIGQFKQY